VDQQFWVASTAGAGRQVLTWDIEPGDWDVVVMNPDAARGVSVDATVAVKTNLLLPIGLGLLAIGLVAGAGAAVLILIALRKEGTSHSTALPAPARTTVAA
jgi:hypothetical protein